MSSGRIPSVEGGIQPTIVDAKGDLIVATAADTVSRLAVGSNDQVLTADSSTATGLKWATPSSGSMTLLSTTTITSGTTVTVSSISQAYKNLYVEYVGLSKSSGNADLRVLPDSSSSLARGTYTRSNAANEVSVLTGNYIITNQNLLAADTNNAFYLTIYNYSSTTDRKGFFVVGSFVNSASTTVGYTASGAIYTTSAIDSIQWQWDDSGNFNAGTIRVYGVN